jgi:regulator of sigma E protease
MDFFINCLNNLYSNTCILFYYIPLVLMGLIGLCLLVIFHEFGHFIFAKIFNVHVPSFSIGFGPRLIEKKIGETTFAISAIPLGGYVEIAGAAEVGQGEQKFAKSQDERSFNQKPYWQKMWIISGGILFNIIFTYLALSLLLYLGSPCIGSRCAETNPPLISYIIAGKPAEKAGLKAGDTILKINNKEVSTISSLSEELKKFINQNATLTILRNNKEEKNIEINVGSQKVGDKTLPLLGALWSIQPLSFKDALIEGWKSTIDMIVQIASALKNITKTKDVGGPLILLTYLTKFAGEGLKTFLFILAFISINLAIFNVIPLPIFDGGQALFYTIEAIMGRPISDEIRYKIHYYTWILLIILLVYLTYNDLLRILKEFVWKQ